MTGQRESRQAGNLTANELAPKPTTPTVTPIRANSAEPAPLIGATVEKPLDRILWQVLSGDVELYQLTPALVAWWTLAHNTGRVSRQAEIDRLNSENDRLYQRAWNPLAPIKIGPSYAELEKTRHEIYSGGAK